MTSRHTSNRDRGELERLIDELPAERLTQAFTHPSWAAERGESYERLEFLGDSVLELAVARALYEEYPDFAEGELTKVRAQVVSRESCAVVARELGLGERFVARASERRTEDAEQLAGNPRVLAALLEAALASVFLEHGFDAVEPAIASALRDRISHALSAPFDHKTDLQEAAAKEGRKVSYEVLKVVGAPHRRTFTIAATVDGRQLGVGEGPTKKDAEQAAAKEALESLVRGHD